MRRLVYLLLVPIPPIIAGVLNYYILVSKFSSSYLLHVSINGMFLVVCTFIAAFAMAFIVGFSLSRKNQVYRSRNKLLKYFECYWNDNNGFFPKHVFLTFLYVSVFTIILTRFFLENRLPK